MSSDFMLILKDLIPWGYSQSEIYEHGSDPQW